MEKHFMIDIETTGTDKIKDSILEVAMLELEYKYPYWYPTGRTYQSLVHYPGQPETPFAKQHMVDLYGRCNNTSPAVNLELVSKEMREFLHHKEAATAPSGWKIIPEDVKPKFFIGWNASGFDLPFVAAKGLLIPSFYQIVGNKEEIRGDIHYRVYEQTGALNVICNITGLDRKTIQILATDLNPTDIKLPPGKAHDALHDCYSQLIMINGLIEIGRKGILR
jgi:DNA polymerase III epsilon subunit-like protein